MVLSTILLRFIYPPPESLLITVMSIMSSASLVIAGLMEITGMSMMHYSKMFNTRNKNVEASQSKMIEFSGRNGMLLAYFPAFVAGATSLALMQDEGRRFTLVTSAIAVHFFKRLFEALSFTVGSTSYLIGRSYATRKWYLSKFEDFPKDVKAIIPYVF